MTPSALIALLLYLAILAYCASLILREQRRAKAREREAWAEYHAAVGASQSRHPSRLPSRDSVRTAHFTKAGAGHPCAACRRMARKAER